jgi:hypothetical protein
LSPTEVATLQGKLTPVGNRIGGELAVAFKTSGGTLDLGVFRPFYRAQFMGGYTLDLNHPEVFSATAGEFVALIDSVATLSGVTDGGVDPGGGLSFSLSVVEGNTTRVFESIIDATNSCLLLGKMLEALATNQVGRSTIEHFACSLGLLPGPTPIDMTSAVSIDSRGFRKDRASGQYVGHVRVTNIGVEDIGGPIILTFRPGENITLVGGSGFTCALWPPGAPYLEFARPIAHGQHLDVVLRFENPDESPIALSSPRVYAGRGFR